MSKLWVLTWFQGAGPSSVRWTNSEASIKKKLPWQGVRVILTAGLLTAISALLRGRLLSSDHHMTRSQRSAFRHAGRTCYCLLLEHVCRNRSQTLKSLPRWTQLIRFPGMGTQRNLDVGESSRPETMMGTVAGHAAHCQHSGYWTQPWAVKCSWTMELNPRG